MRNTVPNEFWEEPCDFELRVGVDASIHPIEVVEVHEGADSASVYWANDVETLKNLYATGKISLRKFEELVVEFIE